MSDLFKEPTDPFATEPKPKSITEPIIPPGREMATTKIELKGFRNPRLIACRLDGNIVTLRIQQDSLPDQLIEDCLYD